jgi:ribosomal protein S18 acetylase RimI-like enzyme
MVSADVDATTYVRKAALDGLAISEGRAIEAWEPRREPHFDHLLRTDPDGAWVATADGTVVGFAMGFVRESVWFLAQLFVQPDMHAAGIGSELLRRAIDSGRAKDARVFAVVSSTSPVAQSLYMRAGMFGIAIGYRMRGPVSALTSLAEASGEIVQAGGDWPAQVADLDRFAYGGARGADHTLYSSHAWSDAGDYVFGLRRGSELIGYGYCDGNGHIGPFAVYEAADLRCLLRAAGDWLSARGVESAYGYVPSSNPTVMATLLAGGWRVNGWTFLKATERFGHLDCYLPGGGLLL